MRTKSMLSVTIIWDEFLKIIKEEAGSQVVETWFKAVSLSHWDSTTTTATLLIPNQFVKNWIQQNYSDLLRIHLARLLHAESIAFNFTCAPKNTAERETITITPATVLHKPASSLIAHQKEPLTRALIKVGSIEI